MKSVINPEPIEEFIKQLSVNSIFGAPVREHDTVVIPVAQLQYGFGYGGGYGEMPKDASAADERTAEAEPGIGESAAHEDVKGEADNVGAGGGLGAGGYAKPCGFIRISADGVTYEPIEDPMRVAIAGILMAAWSIFWVTATVRHIAKLVAKTRQTALKME